MRPLLATLAAILLLGPLACVDPKSGGSTGDTALYVHAEVGGKAVIYVYGNMEALASGTGDATATRTISADLLDQALPVAWGGMALDSLGNRLYIVAKSSGQVVRIDGLRRQDGRISSIADIVSFTLGASDSDRLSSGSFGQAAFDATTGNLYVTETNSGSARIWTITNPQDKHQDDKVGLSQVTLAPGDLEATGLASSGGKLFAYFNSGSGVGVDRIAGPRLRQGFAGGFTPDSSVIIGDATNLGAFGSLAYDTSGTLFVARHNTKSSGTSAPISLFTTGQFNSGSYNQTPRLLGSSSDQANLRVIAHPGNRDWLVALTSTVVGDVETGANQLWIWKAPASSAPTLSQRTLPTGSEARALALDGNN